jgi:tRNA A-37 threonylcarbamoyl transferase component Bud32
MSYLCPRCHRPLTEQTDQRISCSACGLTMELPTADTRPGVQPATSANVLGLGLAIDHSGQTLGPYQLQVCLGAGGMGTVYRASTIATHQIVAVKVLYPHLALQPDLVARFKREADLLCQLDHPAVVRGLGRGHENGLHFLVMEFVEGLTLETRLAAGAIPAAEARTIALQIAAALEVAHGHGIVHRDLKPANVMLTPQGAKVLDFGIAGTIFAEHTLTQSDAVIGTFNYMAPEQRQGGQRVDGRADLFALGVIVYRMLTGQLPIGTYAPPSTLVRGLSRRWDRLVSRALQPLPGQRFQSAADLSRELTALTAPRGGLVRSALVVTLVAAAAVAAALGAQRWIASALPDLVPGGAASEDGSGIDAADAAIEDGRTAADAALPDAGVPDGAQPDTARQAPMPKFKSKKKPAKAAKKFAPAATVDAGP